MLGMSSLNASSVSGYQVIQAAAQHIIDSLSARTFASGSLFPKRLFAGTAVEEFTNAFGLSVFERDLLVLLASLNVSPDLAVELGLASGSNLSFNTALQVLVSNPEAVQDVFVPTARLRDFKFIYFADEPQMALPHSRPLLLDEWVFHALIGLVTQDSRLKTMVSQVALSHGALSVSQQAMVARVSSVALQGGLVVQIAGAEAELRLHLAVAMALDLNCLLFELNISRLDLATVDDFVVRWNRFVALQKAVLLLNIGDFAVGETLDKDPRLLAARGFVLQLEGLLFVTSRVVLAWGRETMTFEVKRPTIFEQRELWRDRFDVGVLSDAQIIDLTAQFDFSGAQIARVASDTLGSDPSVLSATLWSSSLALLRPALEGLTQRIEPASRASWSQLILPERELSTLKRLVAHVKQRQVVYENWGWSEDSSRGFGISALFGGSSGTGKTFSAEIIAKELNMDLQRIDLPSIVSKYIGESEKLLSKLFDAAEYGGCILLFDEADAIFGKRSEVKDSNDRYANLEVSYLLQRMESFRGLVILTTNQESNMDSAFMRRIRFVVQFPVPDAKARVGLWHGIFPRNTPTQKLNFERLAQLEVSGGNVRSIALNAAFNASSDQVAVSMGYLHEAALEELRKLKRLPRPGEFDGWL